MPLVLVCRRTISSFQWWSFVSSSVLLLLGYVCFIFVIVVFVVFFLFFSLLLLFCMFLCFARCFSFYSLLFCILNLFLRDASLRHVLYFTLCVWLPFECAQRQLSTQVTRSRTLCTWSEFFCFCFGFSSFQSDSYSISSRTSAHLIGIVCWSEQQFTICYWSSLFISFRNLQYFYFIYGYAFMAFGMLFGVICHFECGSTPKWILLMMIILSYAFQVLCRLSLIMMFDA